MPTQMTTFSLNPGGEWATPDRDGQVARRYADWIDSNERHLLQRTLTPLSVPGSGHARSESRASCRSHIEPYSFQRTLMQMSVRLHWKSGPCRSSISP
jgi:hypothetical protein